MRPIAILMLLAAVPVAAEPVPTNITVRAIARDAKAIYDAVGGARVTITEVATGKVLAEGLQTGKSAGSTARIMNEPRKRGELVYDAPDAAVFHATIPLEKPTLVKVTAEGPLAFPQATRSASKTLLLLPGEHLGGDGVLLEIHGLIVVASAPASDSDSFDVKATVQMACGCQLSSGGTWNADEFEVTATLLGNDGRRLASGPMQWRDDRWVASFARPSTAPASVEVVAAHTASANFGMHTIELK